MIFSHFVDNIFVAACTAGKGRYSRFIRGDELQVDNVPDNNDDSMSRLYWVLGRSPSLSPLLSWVQPLRKVVKVAASKS